MADQLFQVSFVADHVRFALRTLRRHFLLVPAVFALVFGPAWMIAAGWPKTYQVDGMLLVQRNAVMSSLVNPGRTIPREAEIPTRAAAEIVRSRENLLAILNEANILEEWDRTRTPLFKLKDRVFQWVSGVPSQEERVDGLVGLLEARLLVGTTAEGAVTFFVEWPDPNVAYRVVDKAMQSFLEFRRASETSAIADSITILDRSVEALEAQVSATVEQLPRRPVSASPVRRVVQVPAVPAIPLPSGPSAETVVRLARLKSALESRQQELARLDAVRAQQLVEAQSRLSAAQAVYTQGHPTVLSLQQTVSQLSRETAEMAAARREARELEAEYDSLSTRVSVENENVEQARVQAAARRAAILDAGPGPAVASSQFDLSTLFGADPTEPIALRLKVEMAELAAVRERANAARAELSSSQAGFKHQYSVVRPPQLPRRPSGPNLPAILAAAAIASLLLAIALALSIDLASGLVYEPWQLERELGVPVSARFSKL